MVCTAPRTSSEMPSERARSLNVPSGTIPSGRLRVIAASMAPSSVPSPPAHTMQSASATTSLGHAVSTKSIPAACSASRVASACVRARPDFMLITSCARIVLADQVRVDLRNRRRFAGKLNHLNARRRQLLGTVTLDKNRRLTHREHDARNSGVDNARRARRQTGNARTARLKRGIQRAAAQIRTGFERLLDRDLLGVRLRAALATVAVGDHYAVFVRDDCADRIRAARWQGDARECDRVAQESLVAWLLVHGRGCSYSSTAMSPNVRTPRSTKRCLASLRNEAALTSRGACASPTKNGAMATRNRSNVPAAKNAVRIRVPPSTNSECRPQSASAAMIAAGSKRSMTTTSARSPIRARKRSAPSLPVSTMVRALPSKKRKAGSRSPEFVTVTRAALSERSDGSSRRTV